MVEWVKLGVEIVVFAGGVFWGSLKLAFAFGQINATLKDIAAGLARHSALFAKIPCLQPHLCAEVDPCSNFEIAEGQ